MTIRLHNTRTRTREDFAPIDETNVRMYVCGPTVYDRAHLGNARPVVVFDVLYRLLRHVYGPDAVTYVRNFTDVDDKINARAAETGRDISEITDETIGWYHEDMGALGVLRPDHEPRATAYIPQMVEMIEALVEKGHAYAAEGHVLFRVDSWRAGYGRLSGRSLDDMIAGARVEVAPYKENPMDFVLWKPSDAGTPGWDSPWGRGRPGWHIECSAMADKLLWSDPKEAGRLSAEALKHEHVFDIHAGGNDLMFPHHENEIAQSCCANGTERMANVWLHNEMLQVEGKKMSKSLGNFFTVRDLLDQGIPGEVIRFVMLSTHYRKPMDWTEKKRKDAEKKLDSLARALGSALRFDRPPADDFDSLPVSIKTALTNDLDTHSALLGLQASAELVIEIETGRVVGGDPEAQAVEFLTGLNVLGLYELLLKRQALFSDHRNILGPIELDLTARYALAKQDKDFSQVDRIKKILTLAGVEIKISSDGVKLSPKPDFDPDKLGALNDEESSV